MKFDISEIAKHFTQTGCCNYETADIDAPVKRKPAQQGISIHTTLNPEATNTPTKRKPAQEGMLAQDSVKRSENKKNSQ
jgi:hypothetical protein